MGLQRVGHDWVTELTDRTERFKVVIYVIFFFFLPKPWVVIISVAPERNWNQVFGTRAAITQFLSLWIHPLLRSPSGIHCLLSAAFASPLVRSKQPAHNSSYAFPPLHSLLFYIYPCNWDCTESMYFPDFLCNSFIVHIPSQYTY